MTLGQAAALKTAEVLVEALPFIRKFHGDVVIVKLGGSSLEEAKKTVLEDVVLLRYIGMKPVVVHGGGPEISAMQQRLGIESRFVDGLRVTDERSMEVVKMVLTGKVNPELVSALNTLGAQAVGISGEDGPCILARPYSGSNGEDLGPVGWVAKVKAALRSLAGVEKAHIINGRVPHALLLELLTERGIGTMIVPG